VVLHLLSIRVIQRTCENPRLLECTRKFSDCLSWKLMFLIFPRSSYFCGFRTIFWEQLSSITPDLSKLSPIYPQRYLPSVLKSTTIQAGFSLCHHPRNITNTQKETTLSSPRCLHPVSLLKGYWSRGAKLRSPNEGWHQGKWIAQVKLQQPPNRKGAWVAARKSEKQYYDRWLQGHR
jgi:hypothetical protein